MKTLCVISCGKAKIWDKNPRLGPTPAREVYTGSYTTSLRLYAERFYPRSWVILSAKHGFLWPNEVVDRPYDTTFLKRTKDVISRERLREQVQELALADYSEVVVIAGAKYAAEVRKAFEGLSVKVRTPLAGAGGMALMQSRLRRALAKGKALSR
jgi:hypothetical protein